MIVVGNVFVVLKRELDRGIDANVVFVSPQVPL